VWSLLRHSACRKAWEGLHEELQSLRADHADLFDRFIRLQGRLAKRGELSLPTNGDGDRADVPDGSRRALLNAAIRAKDRTRVRELLTK
jgi:hypothetical protein